jgi:hypothetical protein
VLQARGGESGGDDYVVKRVLFTVGDGLTVGAVSEPRKHHRVAQLYQRGFARKRGKSSQAVVLDRATGEHGLRNVRNVFAGGTGTRS